MNQYTPIPEITLVDLLLKGWPQGDCLEWPGAMRKGYGTLRHRGKQLAVHRLSFSLANPGVDITNLVICHKCDNTRCFNPLHLFAGTHKDNTQDCISKGRLFKQNATHCPRGHEYTDSDWRMHNRDKSKRIRCCKQCINQKGRKQKQPC